MTLTAINNSYMRSIVQKTRSNLGKKVQKFRKLQGYSQEKFAEMIKISRTHIGHIEQGRKSPSLKTLEKIARALKVKLGDLLS